MAKTNKKPQISTISSRTSSADRSERTVALSDPEKPAASPKTSVSYKTDKTPGPTHQQIADRAKEIWRKKGCPAGQDEMNWYEAEAQLKRELAVR
jgi:hypothetical protein